jgi:hypothetical protein
VSSSWFVQRKSSAKFHLADIEATLQSIDKIASDRVGIAAEEQVILRGSVFSRPLTESV